MVTAAETEVTEATPPSLQPTADAKIGGVADVLHYLLEKVGHADESTLRRFHHVIDAINGGHDDLAAYYAANQIEPPTTAATSADLIVSQGKLLEEYRQALEAANAKLAAGNGKKASG